MASHSPILLSSFFFFLTIALLSPTTTHCTATSPPVSATSACRTTLYPGYCKGLLQSGNRSTTVYEYGRFSFKKSISQANKFLRLVNRYIAKSRHLRLSAAAVAALHDCRLLAELNLDFLTDSYRTVGSSSNSNNKKERVLPLVKADDVRTLLSGVLTNQQTCLDGIKSAGPTWSTLRNGVVEPLSNDTKLYSISLSLFTKAWAPKNKKPPPPTHRRHHPLRLPAFKPYAVSSAGNRHRRLLQEDDDVLVTEVSHDDVLLDKKTRPPTHRRRDSIFRLPGFKPSAVSSAGNRHRRLLEDDEDQDDDMLLLKKTPPPTSTTTRRSSAVSSAFKGHRRLPEDDDVSLHKKTPPPTTGHPDSTLRPPASKPSTSSAAENRRRRLLQVQTEDYDYDDNVLVSDMVTVNQDGSGDYRSINDAVSAAPNSTDGSGGYFLIYVVAGVYEENVNVDKKKYIMMIGDGINQTIITGNRSVVDNYTTFNSATFAVVGTGFKGINMTIRNTAGAIKHQAVALRNSADLSSFYSCSFEGYQDTLYVHSLRQFYRDCDIYGTVDFIFGNAAVVLQNCNLYPRLPMVKQFNAITAQGRTDPNQNTGISIYNCTIQAADDLAAGIKNGTKTQTFLGRPWKQYSRTVIMDTFIDDVVNPAGWRDWNGTFALDTLYYGEYNNRGPGATTNNRVTWLGYHTMNVTDATNFTVSSFVLGDDWLPQTGIPYTSGLV